MNPLDARESAETYEYPARPYTLPMRPVQTFRVLSESGDVPEYIRASIAEDEAAGLPEDPGYRGAWSDKYLTAEDARVLRQNGV